jgi:hypothetical protein
LRVLPEEYVGGDKRMLWLMLVTDSFWAQMAARELAAVEGARRMGRLRPLTPAYKNIFFARGFGAGEKVFFTKRTQLKNAQI